MMIIIITNLLFQVLFEEHLVLEKLLVGSHGGGYPGLHEVLLQQLHGSVLVVQLLDLLLQQLLLTLQELRLRVQPEDASL